MHLARIFAPAFCPDTHVSSMRYGEICTKYLVEMGRGAQEAKLLGVCEPYLPSLEALSSTMHAVAKAYGFDTTMLWRRRCFPYLLYGTFSISYLIILHPTCVNRRDRLGSAFTICSMPLFFSRLEFFFADWGLALG